MSRFRSSGTPFVVRVLRKPLFACLMLVLTLGMCGCWSSDNNSPGNNEPSESSRSAETPVDPARPEPANPASDQSPRIAAGESLDGLQSKFISNVMFLQVREINKDSLGGVLADQMESSDSPVHFINGKLYLVDSSDDVAAIEETDPDLEEFEPDNNSTPESTIQSKSPPDQCALFVNYVTEYQGEGRQSSHSQWYAFKTNQDSFTTTFESPSDNLTCDPDDNLMPFETWLDTVRLGPEKETRFVIVAESNRLELKLGDESFLIEAGKGESVISQKQSSIDVSRLPLTMASYTDDDGNILGTKDDVVIPGKEFGQVEFSTVILANYFGSVPLVVKDFDADREDN